MKKQAPQKKRRPLDANEDDESAAEQEHDETEEMPDPGAGALGIEFKGMTRGVLLAYLARARRQALTIERQEEGFSLRIDAKQKDVEAWPLGWPCKASRSKAAPKLMEFLNTEVDDVPLAKVLDAVTPRLDIPVLIDVYALRYHGIDPHEIVVEVPETRTTYSQLLRRVLGQAGLMGELRLDDDGMAFFWITTVKKAP